MPGHLEEGQPYPLGATWDGSGVNFAVVSAHATGLELCLFDGQGRCETARREFRARTLDVWHGYLPGAAPGLVYGLRAHGPYAPRDGYRFNSNKLLLDPYAKALSGSLRWSDALYGYSVDQQSADLSFDSRDSAADMVKAVVVDEHFAWDDDKRPAVPWSDTVIYEAHVRGLSLLLDAVPERERGTFVALGHPFVIEHLRRLGITALELMPVAAFLQDRELLQRSLSNYWGYSPLAFFATEPRYGASNELRSAIARLHRAGIEVVLDVVFNHTCESDERGPTLSWRGLDNTSYYRLADDRRFYRDNAGTGNALDLSQPRVLQMVMDCLRYWTQSFHVDGFRFDLCAALGRGAHGFDANANFFAALRQDPVLAPLKMIAEPWDIAPDGYQLGHFPPPFAEWNDRFRDGVRRYWRGDRAMRPELSRRLAGSADHFGNGPRQPSTSINYLSCHDGMTLEDIVSYSRKRNEANGEDNRDGTSDDYSANWGAEGATDDNAVVERRQRVKRAMLLTLFGAVGTPMLLAGDEFGRTQRGNNNAYCQDNEISWLDWTEARSKQGSELANFVSRLVAIRRAEPALHAGTFPDQAREIASGVNEIQWYDERGVPLAQGDWENAEGRALIMYLAQPGTGARVAALMMNASDEPLLFRLLPWLRWRVLADSSVPERETAVTDGVYLLGDHAAALAVGMSEDIGAGKPA